MKITRKFTLMAARKFKLLASIGGIFAATIILVNMYQGGKGNHTSNHASATKLSHHPKLVDHFHDKIEYELEQATNVDNLPARIREMLRIRKSVMNELTSLESKRNKISSEVSQLTSKYDIVKADLSRKQGEVDRLKSLISQLELLQKEASLQEQPFILRPLRILPSSVSVRNNGRNRIAQSNNCSMSDCFDYSRCPLTSGFPVFLYPCPTRDQLIASHPDLFSSFPPDLHVDSEQCQRYLDSFKSYSLTVTSNPSTACVFITIPPFVLSAQSPVSEQVHQVFKSYLEKLDHWANNGQNHIIVNLLSPSLDLHEFLPPNHAIIAQSTYSVDTFRHNFDLAIVSPASEPTVHQNLSISPARRPILASFQSLVNNSSPSSDFPADIISFLIKLRTKTSSDSMKNFHIDLNSDQVNVDILRRSTFSLLIAREKSPNSNFTEKLSQLLSAETIPVIIGATQATLPYSQVIDWSKAVIFLPLARLTEINLVLGSFTDADIIQMKMHGRMLFSRIFSSTQMSLAFLMSVVRTARLQIAPPAADSPSGQLMYSKDEMKFYEPNVNEGADGGDGEWSESGEMDEELGPVEPPRASLSFTRNFSISLTSQYDLFNSEQLTPLALYPYTPFDPILPTEARFIGSSHGFRPIGEGAGGSGFEFSRSLGGNLPREQFTIVVLTYEREAVLMDTLHRLKGLPYLNKVIVIWNNPHKLPDSDLRWPLIDVPIRVIKTPVNSLNNRFIPYDEIETEAILSLDDDTHLRHDEIIFAFRVWREARDRIVGFPGRYHAWDLDHKSWLYNSNHSCELSMVLTGAAFFHKYFAYRYTYSMPERIREIVNEYTNCEDIAMNFLVSHITRKPPIKVTSRWTFTCAGCSMLPSAALSESNSHFLERHKCINLFTQIYGYNPLLNTQFRADSVLFKTRIPREKQKCFKFV